jgi:hypothetical protein
MTQNGRLSAKTDALALAIAAGKSLRDAAAVTGLSERTAYRRLAEESFRQRINDLRAEMMQRSLGKMADAMADAADVLRKLMAEAERESVRLGAARTVLELSVRIRETVDLEVRVKALEEREKKK